MIFCELKKPVWYFRNFSGIFFLGTIHDGLRSTLGLSSIELTDLKHRIRELEMELSDSIADRNNLLRMRKRQDEVLMKLESVKSDCAAPILSPPS
jgi:hypothetical protein